MPYFKEEGTNLFFIGKIAVFFFKLRALKIFNQYISNNVCKSEKKNDMSKKHVNSYVETISSQNL